MDGYNKNNDMGLILFFFDNIRGGKVKGGVRCSLANCVAMCNHCNSPLADSGRTVLAVGSKNGKGANFG